MINPAKPLAVITGASSGIGYELAKIFALNDYDLIIAAENPEIYTCASELERLGATVKSVQCDLAAKEGVNELYMKIGEHGRPVDAICINAGVGVGGDFVRNTDIEDEENMINLNILSTVRLAKMVLKDMVKRNSGKVLFTASVASTMPAPFEAVYGASKAFVLSFSQALRSELKDTGITVTALMPGPTETNFFHRAGLDDTKVGAGKKDDPATVAQDGFDALMAGDDAVIAGSLKSKSLGLLNEILPETIKAQLHRNLAEPGSARH